MPVHVGFLVVRLFPFYSLILAIETLRLANRFACKRIFEWCVLSEDGKAVEASNGMSVESDRSVSDEMPLSYAFVISGDDQSCGFTPRVRRWLVRLGRAGVALGGFDSGAFLLAQAKVIGRARVVVHPAAVPSFQEQFVDVQIAQESLAVDHGRLTCAGGLTVVPLMMHLVRLHCGAEVAAMVASDLMLPPDFSWDLDYAGAKRAETNRNSIIDRALRVIEENVDAPLSVALIAREVGLSTRELSRQFKRRLATSPGRHALRVRLNHAQQLLFQSGLSISSIAVASGFQSLSSFSRAFKAEFGKCPRDLLANLRIEGNASIVPVSQRRRRIKVR